MAPREQAQSKGPIRPFRHPFPPEIFHIILPFLQRPLPLPLSRPDRNAFQQPHLSVCMRVSRFWRSILEPLLYTHIVVDTLYQMGVNYHHRSPGGQFNYTKTLRIEYRPKPDDPEYDQIMGPGPPMWLYVGADEATAGRLAKLANDKELQELKYGLGGLVRNTMAKVFPKLETIAVDSLYGNDNHSWKRYKRTWRTEKDTEEYHTVTLLFHRFLESGHTLKSLCTRDSDGPLTLSYHPIVKPQVGTYSRTVHFGRHPDQLALGFGEKVRWVSDLPPTHDFAALASSLIASSDELRTHRVGPFLSSAAVDIDIFGSAPSYSSAIHDLPSGMTVVDQDGPPYENERQAVSEKELREMTDKLGEQLQQRFRDGSGLQDRISWRTTADAGHCAACGLTAGQGRG